MYNYFFREDIPTLSSLLAYICNNTSDNEFYEDKSQLPKIIQIIEGGFESFEISELFEALEWIKNILHYDDFWRWSKQEDAIVRKVKTLYNILISQHGEMGYGYEETSIISKVFRTYITQHPSEDTSVMQQIVCSIDGVNVLNVEDYRHIKSGLIHSVEMIQSDLELCNQAALVLIQTEAIIKHLELKEL